MDDYVHLVIGDGREPRTACGVEHPAAFTSDLKLVTCPVCAQKLHRSFRRLWELVVDS